MKKILLSLLLILALLLSFAACDTEKKEDENEDDEKSEMSAEDNIDAVVDGINQGIDLDKLLSGEDITINGEKIDVEAYWQQMLNSAFQYTAAMSYMDEKAEIYMGYKDGSICINSVGQEAFVFIEDDYKIVSVAKDYDGSYSGVVSDELAEYFAMMGSMTEAPVEENEEIQEFLNIIESIEFPEISKEDIEYKDGKYYVSNDYLLDVFGAILDAAYVYSNSIGDEITDVPTLYDYDYGFNYEDITGEYTFNYEDITDEYTFNYEDITDEYTFNYEDITGDYDYDYDDGYDEDYTVDPDYDYSEEEEVAPEDIKAMAKEYVDALNVKLYFYMEDGVVTGFGASMNPNKTKASELLGYETVEFLIDVNKADYEIKAVVESDDEILIDCHVKAKAEWSKSGEIKKYTFTADCKLPYSDWMYEESEEKYDEYYKSTEIQLSGVQEISASIVIDADAAVSGGEYMSAEASYKVTGLEASVWNEDTYEYDYSSDYTKKYADEVPALDFEASFANEGGRYVTDMSVSAKLNGETASLSANVDCGFNDDITEGDANVTVTAVSAGENVTVSGTINVDCDSADDFPAIPAAVQAAREEALEEYDNYY